MHFVVDRDDHRKHKVRGKPVNSELTADRLAQILEQPVDPLEVAQYVFGPFEFFHGGIPARVVRRACRVHQMQCPKNPRSFFAKFETHYRDPTSKWKRRGVDAAKNHHRGFTSFDSRRRDSAESNRTGAPAWGAILRVE